ncbi:MAG: exosortase H [Gammaproteobacteria bacterium]|jgi:exosortase H (IPTLxxWG-CTERM-specific)|nr:exosortase H [Gammaproteobacteria bacterium]
MSRFFFTFLAILSVLFVLQLTPWGQSAFVVPFTALIAQISAKLLQLWDPQVLAQGKIIWDPGSGFAVSIEAGCNGVEAGIILISAMLAYPAPWSAKLVGILLGNLTVQTLNLVRIISLFYLGQWSQSAFEWAHLYIWQALIMLDVLVVFLLWLRWLGRPSPAAPAANPAA